jgi:hypothetical protein
MARALIVDTTVNEGESVETVCRLTVPSNQGERLMLGSDVSTWEIRVFDKDGATPGTALHELTGQDPDEVIGALRFDFDIPGGYNFRHVLFEPRYGPHIGGHTYLAEYRIFTFAFGVQVLNNRIRTVPILSV